MADEHAPAEREQRLNEVLAAYLEAAEAGHPPDRQEWLARHPDLAEELRAFLANREALAWLAEPRRPAPEDQTRPAPPPVLRAEMEPGERLGDYEVLEVVGRGGMGIVYKARQMSLNRVVALKVVRAGTQTSPQDLARFRAEAEAVARLDHPNIVHVYEVGKPDGLPYFSLEFVAGGSLAQRLNGAPLPARQAAELLRTLAGAVHAAHRRGIIHRDLKPANILLAVVSCQLSVASQKEAGAASLATDHWQLTTAKITDFGLAKCLDAEAGQTVSGQILGTASYMAPEQAAGQSRSIGPAADVYALGAILYECLTGRPPFRGETLLDTLEQVRHHEPVPPRLLNPKVPRDLQTICLKCLAKAPAERYASAADLADDLGRFLRDEPVQARSFNAFDRLARTLSRSQHDAEFANWGTMFLLFAGIVLVSHVLKFVLIESGRSEGLVWLVRLGQFVVMALVFWRYRPRALLPTGAVERQLWSVWIGYLAAYWSNVLASWLLVDRAVIARGAAGPVRWQDLVFYPGSALLSGLAFFVMGSSYWGWYYAFGLGFFALAAVMTLRLEWAPLEFGLLWTAFLVAIGLHLRRRGSAAEGEDASAKRR
jgi:serine/threonine-protein kinase